MMECRRHSLQFGRWYIFTGIVTAIGINANQEKPKVVTPPPAAIDAADKIEGRD